MNAKLFNAIIKNNDIMDGHGIEESLTFNTRSAAIDFIVSYLTDEGYIEDEQIDEVVFAIEEDGYWRDDDNSKEFIVIESEWIH